MLQRGIRSRSRRVRFAVAALAVNVLWACGAGTGAALSGGSGGGTNAAPTIASFGVVDPTTGGAPRTSPAQVRFVLSDAEGDPARVEFFYEVPGQPPREVSWITTLEGFPVPGVFAASPEGTDHALRWDYAREYLLPHDASFTPDIRVYAMLAGSNVILPGANATTVGLGNDAPVVSVETPPPEVDGVVPIRFHLSDSSLDPHAVQVEYDVANDGPDPGWRTARPGGLATETATPDFAFQDVIAGPAGVDLVFFWDSDFDLRDLERDVRLRVMPFDPVVAGSPAITNAFRVDNNAAPIVQVQEGAFLANPDSLRGIPVPFRVLDEESDPVTVVFQWRREGESFPALPETPVQIETILASPELRAQYRVCEPYPLRFRGRAQRIDATHLRLPDLLSGLSFLARAGLAGRELEFERPSHHLLAATDTWPSNPLARPVAVLPLQAGTHAMVLDEVQTGTWTLREIHLLDGLVTRTITTGSGTPTAMCFELGEATALVASSAAGVWQLDRVELTSADVARVADASAGPVESGPIRGIASLGTSGAVATVGSSLLKLQWGAGFAARAGVVRTGLAAPHGVVVDPRNPGSVLVAENEANEPTGIGRVVSIEIATQQVRPVVVRPNPTDGAAFPRPRGLALGRGGTRLYALCETELGRVALRSVELGRADVNHAVELGPPLPGNPSQLASGERDLLLTVGAPVGAESASVYVAGGVEARARIQSVTHGTGIVALEAPLALPGPALPDWTGLDTPIDSSRVDSAPTGISHQFTWNGMASHGGRIFLRATPFDAELGTSDATTGPKPMSSGLDGAPTLLPTGEARLRTLCVDMDLDGDLDLVSGSFGGTLTIHRQSLPGQLEPVPVTTLGGEPAQLFASTVEAADLDGDERPDLVCLNSSVAALSIFWQLPDGSFDPRPTNVGALEPVPDLLAVRVADLDRDGDADLVCPRRGSPGGSVVLFPQTAHREFAPLPVQLNAAPPPGRLLDVQCADLDADGRLDLLCGLDSSNVRACVYWQGPAGAFEAPPTVLGVDSGASITGLSRVHCADLDGDGLLEVVQVWPGRASHFTQNAPGQFQQEPDFMVAHPMRDVDLVDFDGNGALDLVFRDNFERSVLLQSGDGSFDTDPIAVLGDDPAVPVLDAHPADFDADGRIDLVTARLSSDGLGLHFQRGPGRTEFESDSVASTQSPSFPTKPFVGDLDSDGDLDLACTGLNFGQLSVAWQTVPGTYDPAVSAWTPPPGLAGVPTGVVSADCDSDGDLDLITSIGNDLAVILQTEPGVFATQPILSGPFVGAGSIVPEAVTDFDGDGDMDVQSTDFNGGTVRVFWQVAPGHFGLVPATLFSCCPLAARAGDLDADGDLDIATANFDGNSVDVFWQIAPAVFAPEPLRLATQSPVAIQLEDIDADGDLDLVHSGFDFTRVFHQVSRGSFSPEARTLVSSGTEGRSVDLDADGDLDVLVAINTSPPLVRVHWQTAPGAFDTSGTVLGTMSRGFEGVDLDSDGELDCVASGGSGGVLRLLWGGRQ